MNAMVRRTIRHLAIAPIACVALFPNISFAVDLLTENFEGLTLNPIVTFDTEIRSRAAWTKSVPTGPGTEGTWSIDDTGMPAGSLGNPLVGVTEFEGWTFVDRDWWINTAGDQDRAKFVSASGKIAVADSDEWDDFGTGTLDSLPAADRDYDSTLKISAIPLQGVAANTAKLFFHSSWRPEDNQKASLTVKYNDPGATVIELFKWASVESDPNFKPDAVNEAVSINMLNPAGATTASLEFRLWDADNNWWWAIDNLNMFTGASPAQDGALRLTIDRGTGQVSIANNTNGVVNLRGYSIQSSKGTLDEVAATFLGDANPNWTIFDSPEHSELSEGYIPDQYAMPTFASNPTLGKINLGTSWRKFHEDISDISFQYLIAGNNTPQTGIIEFVGNSSQTFNPLDLNFNGSIEIGDYAAFLAGYNVSLTGKTVAQQYNLGDLDGDKKHTVKDFLIFKRQYDAALGAGAFAAALAAVPEPSTAALGMICGAVGLFAGRRRRRRLSSAAAVAVGVLIASAATPASANLPLLVENFEGVVLGPSPDEDPSKLAVWNGSGPAGWTVDRTGVPGVGNPENDGVTDWAGWAFADKDFWVNASGDQGRANFTRGSGTVMIADSDEWQDKNVAPKDFYDTFVTTPVIPIPAGTPAGKIKLAFDSSWLPENPAGLDYGAPIGTLHNQTATIRVKYGAGAFAPVLTWDSTPASGVYHGPEAPDSNPNTMNEAILLDLNYNGTATSVQLEFGLGKSWNNWWWAIDNVRVFVPAEPSILRVNTATGTASIVGGDVISTSITSFDVSSANGNLAPTGNVGLSFTKPNSIDGSDPDSTVGNSINETWQLGAANPNQFAEFFLDGNSAFTSSRTESLGKIFNTATAPANRDLQFTYTTIFGDVINGIVQYVSTPANADFDADGDVDGADFLRWQRGFGTGTTLAQGNADGDSDVDADDLAIWKTQYGMTGLATGATAAVPEPASITLLGAALGLVVSVRRRLNRRLAPAAVAAAATISTVALTPSAAEAQVVPAPFVDRNYRMGDVEPGAANGGTVNVTYDSAGASGQNQLIDMTALSKTAVKPTYVTISGRPDGGTGLGIRLNALATDRNFLRTAPDEALNFPEKSPSSLDGTLPNGTLDYAYINDRGFQLWVQPAVSAAVQHIVMDTNNHGVLINAAGKFSMRYSNLDYVGQTTVVPNTWYHLMVVRPTGPGGGSILYVNGVAEAAATGLYFGEDAPNDEVDATKQDNSPLVVGANTSESPLSLANNSYYRGIVDDLEMFVMGLNTTSDRGEFKFERDNKYAAFFKPTHVADLTGDNAITMADVTIFANHWLDEKKLTWSQAGNPRELVVGDLSTRMIGDLNYDGRVNLSDWAILNQANPAMGAAAMALIQSVPEPAACLLGAISLAGLVATVRRRNPSDCRRRRPQVVC
ncbi:hypothetical protein PLANPX_2547 [Lacipirellula parvula]|uniref:Ice-binding protein C-terminal domain-containing protein n=2 Tax=Lacipirellula parvula TaxID=2650471 RepID=A0A5K7X997_9BACT|nr:hypothetical protein PLANPX_2547 [Lacipirellula parvula]